MSRSLVQTSFVIAALLPVPLSCATDDSNEPPAVDDSAQGGHGSQPIDAGGGGGEPEPRPVDGSGGAPETNAVSRLVVVTERESPEIALQYLHVLTDWPADGALDYELAIELGEFPSVKAHEGAVFVYQPADSTIRKLIVDASGAVASDEKISFASYGVNGYDAENVWVDSDTAFLVDEASAQIIRWNPKAMAIDESVPLPEERLTNDGLPLQLQQGVALGGDVFTSANWRNWDTLEYRDEAAIGVFDVEGVDTQVIADGRCAPSVALSPFDGGDGYVYLVSDAALGFDVLANPKPTEKPLCVLRIAPGQREFDADFFVDLKEATGAPGFYTAHPMGAGKLLVNVWASDVDLAEVRDPGDPAWYWAYPPYFEYRIVDLATKSSIAVEELPRAAVQFSITLRVDGKNYVQLYRADGGSSLHRVDTNGDVTEVLSNGAGVDVQYVGRVTLSAN